MVGRSKSLMNNQEPSVQLIHYARAAFERGLVRGSGGNFSARISPDRMMITASGVSLGDTSLENLVIVNLHTLQWQAPAHLKPSIEYRFHADILRLRADIGAILHVHPPYATAFAVMNIEIPMVTDSGFKHSRIPLVPYAPSGTEELRQHINQAINDEPGCNVLLLAMHGLIACGKDPQDAYLQADLVEELAMIAYLSKGWSRG